MKTETKQTMSKLLVEFYANLYEIQRLSISANTIGTYIEVPDQKLLKDLESIEQSIKIHLSEFEMN